MIFLAYLFECMGRGDYVSGSIGIGTSRMLKFYLKVLYLTCKAPSGELSCPVKGLVLFMLIIVKLLGPVVQN